MPSHVHRSTPSSVVVSVHPFLFIEVSPSAVQSQATSVAAYVCFVGFSGSVVGQAGLVRVPFAVGGVRLIKVGLHHLTSRQVASSSDALVAQSTTMKAAPIMLTLCCTATQTPVI